MTNMTIASSSPPVLDALDDRLVAVRRVLQRRGYRRRVVQGLSRELELGTLRLARVVQRSTSPPSIGDVAEVLTIDPSTASRMVDNAVAAGLLERRPCPDDRRRARLHLTGEGASLLDEVTARRRALLAEVTREWASEDLATLVSLLERLLDGFDEILEGSA